MKINLTIHGRPISKKNSKRIIPVRGRYIPISSKAYLSYEIEALWQLKKIKNKFNGPIKVDYTFYMKGKMDSDFDNMIAGVNDILQKSGLIDDDKNILRGHYEKISGNKDWVTVINIDDGKAGE